MLFSQKLRRYSTIENVGFIGLGQMGNRMVKSLIKSNLVNRLTVFDSIKSATEQIQGNVKIASGWKCFEKSEAVVLMLPTSDSVNDVLFKGDCLVKRLKKDSIVINSGTIGVQISKEIEKELGTSGIKFVDAPVSGGTMGAEKATLTFMVGGQADIIERIKPILLTMGSRVVNCGEVGKGQAAKICNNMLLAIAMLGASETFALAEQMKLDLKVLSNIINTSSGRCWVTEVNNPVPGIVDSSPASNQYNNGFSSQLLLKDIRLAIQESSSSSLDVSLLKSCENQYSGMLKHNQKYSGKDMSIIYQYLTENKK